MFTSETLRTARLVLRRYDEGDREACIELFTDPDVMTYVGNGVITPEAAAKLFGSCSAIYDEGRFDLWAVVESESGAYVGHAELKRRKGSDEVEIIYILRKERWGCGYATEIARLLVEHGFHRYDLPRVLATVDYENLPSLRVLEKAGMRFLREETDEVGPYAVYAAERPAAGSR
jgi:RimJ/RimL family protein N-acetyltransferase